LGTGAASSRPKLRPYDDAVKFVHPLKLMSGSKWLAYCGGERKDLPKKPSDIPTYPEQAYGEEFHAKGGLGGWLGNDTIATRNRKVRPYDEAIKFVHPLKIKNAEEWRAYCGGKRKDLSPKPNDIPSHPDRRYGEEFRKNGGWDGWLGTNNIRPKSRPYDDAVPFVHMLKLKNRDPEWLAYCRGERKDLPPKPNDIPSSPNVVYHEFRQRGGWGAWLGTGKVANQNRVFLTYDEAVKFVHPLKLKNQRQWQAYSAGKRKALPPRPRNIPSNPYGHYGDEFREKGGWNGWVGTKGSSHQRLEVSVPASWKGSQ
jgi:Integrase repeat unit